MRDPNTAKSETTAPRAERGGYYDHETADISDEMNNGPSGPALRLTRGGHFVSRTGLHLSLDLNLKY